MNEDGMKNFSYIWWLKIYQCELCFLFWEGRRDVLQTRQGHACTAQDTFSFQACFTYLTPTIGLLQGGLWSHCVCVWGGGMCTTAVVYHAHEYSSCKLLQFLHTGKSPAPFSLSPLWVSKSVQHFDLICTFTSSTSCYITPPAHKNKNLKKK